MKLRSRAVVQKGFVARECAHEVHGVACGLRMSGILSVLASGEWAHGAVCASVCG